MDAMEGEKFEGKAIEITKTYYLAKQVHQNRVKYCTYCLEIMSKDRVKEE